MNYVKRFTKFVVTASISGSIPFGAATGAAQTANEPAGNYAGIQSDSGASQMSSSEATNGAVFKPLTGFSDSLQAKFHGITLPEFVDQSQPGFKAISLLGKITSKATANGIERSSLDPNPAPKIHGDYLASSGLKYLNPAHSLLVERPETESFVNLSGELNFNLLNPLVQTAFKDQPLLIENKSTRAWTTINGWHPGESTFPDARTYEPHFDLFWVGAAPQR